jgi:ABC-type phosphonate transport system ATPase subunit
MSNKTFGQLGYPGRLIAVEGLDGSGKSTQIKLIKRWMELQGLKVFFSEWNSSVLVKSATSKGKNRELLTPTTFSLIHATDFADRYERQLVSCGPVTWCCVTVTSSPLLRAMLFEDVRPIG